MENISNIISDQFYECIIYPNSCSRRRNLGPYNTCLPPTFIGFSRYGVINQFCRTIAPPVEGFASTRQHLEIGKYEKIELAITLIVFTSFLIFTDEQDVGLRISIRRNTAGATGGLRSLSSTQFRVGHISGRLGDEAYVCRCLIIC